GPSPRVTRILTGSGPTPARSRAVISKQAPAMVPGKEQATVPGKEQGRRPGRDGRPARPGSPPPSPAELRRLAGAGVMAPDRLLPGPASAARRSARLPGARRRPREILTVVTDD